MVFLMVSDTTTFEEIAEGFMVQSFDATKIFSKPLTDDRKWLSLWSKNPVVYLKQVLLFHF